MIQPGPLSMELHWMAGILQHPGEDQFFIASIKEFPQITRTDDESADEAIAAMEFWKDMFFYTAWRGRH